LIWPDRGDRAALQRALHPFIYLLLLQHSLQKLGPFERVARRVYRSETKGLGPITNASGKVPDFSIHFFCMIVTHSTPASSNFPRSFPSICENYIHLRIENYSKLVFSLFPLNRWSVPQIGFGALSLSLTLSTLQATRQGVVQLLKALSKGDVVVAQNTFRLLQLVAKRPLAKVMVATYLVLLGPLFEALSCNGEWQSTVSEYFANTQLHPIVQMAFTLTTSALLYTVWNFPIFGHATQNLISAVGLLTLGLALAALKEITGTLWAPATLNVLTNAVAVSQVWNL